MSEEKSKCSRLDSHGQEAINTFEEVAGCRVLHGSLQLRCRLSNNANTYNFQHDFATAMPLIPKHFYEQHLEISVSCVSAVNKLEAQKNESSVAAFTVFLFKTVVGNMLSVPDVNVQKTIDARKHRGSRFERKRRLPRHVHFSNKEPNQNLSRHDSEKQHWFLSNEDF